jgi:hypothetical protein
MERRNFFPPKKDNEMKIYRSQAEAALDQKTGDVIIALAWGGINWTYAIIRHDEKPPLPTVVTIVKTKE